MIRIPGEFEQLLSSYGFKKNVNTIDEVNFESANVALKFYYDERSREFIFEVGYKFDGKKFKFISFAYVFDMLVMKGFSVPTKKDENNIDNILFYYFNILKAYNFLLMGNKLFYKNLKVFYDSKTADYNEKLLREQKISLADLAWAQEDFTRFVIIINSLDMQSLPASYKKKYEIAKRKSLNTN